MSKKVTIIFSVILAIAILGCGGLAFWSSSLNGQLNTLNDDTQAFKDDTASQFTTTKNSINGVDSKLTSFETETTGKFTTVQSDITGLDSNLTAFKTSTASQFDTVQSSITGIDANVAGLNANLASLTTQYSESTINVRRVFDDVIGSVCQIIGNTGSGSGFIYSVEGSVTYIVTCWHVINNQTFTNVILHDGTVKRATVVGSDRGSDVAVIKITGVSNLQPLSLADSVALVPGEPVVVIGNPLGIFETVVYGIISRTNQMAYVGGVGWVANLIQIDAAQNPGNSGGPVFNRDGQVIGIAESGNTAAEGIKNIISSNKVKRVAGALIANGSFTNCILPGTSWTIRDLDSETAIIRGLDNTFGFYFIVAVGVGDVQVNDICIAVDGITIRDFADFFSYTSLFKSVGDTITLSLIRGTGLDITHLEVSLTLVSGWLAF